MNHSTAWAMNLGNLSRLSDAQSRSISPENFTGEKGKGGMATEGTGASAGPRTGPGLEGFALHQHPPPQRTVTLADIDGPGRHPAYLDHRFHPISGAG